MGFYADQVLPRAINVVMNTGELRGLREQVAAPLHGTVVEIGFGTGLNLPHYPKSVERIVAIEPATLGQRLAESRLEACAIPVEFAGLDGQHLPLPDGLADCVLCTWTLCTIPDPVAALNEVRRVLKPGGTFHFVEHGRAPDDGVRAWQDRLNPVQRTVAGGCNLNRPIDTVVSGSGFELLELDTFYMPRAPRFIGYTYRGVARSLVLLLALLGVLSMPSSAAADPASDLAGHWTLDPTVDHSAVVNAEIKRVLNQTIRPIRWVARPLVEQATTPSPELSLVFADDQVTVVASGVSWASDLSGTMVDGRMPDKSKVRYRRWLEDNALMAEGVASTGSSSYRFLVEPHSGDLQLSIVMESRHLPDQLRYTLTYRRSN